ncbi:hypothetical protein ACLBOM_33430 [Escherichia coli]
MLTRPELLAELNLLMTRIASGCRVGLPASGRPVIAVHGDYVSYSSHAPDIFLRDKYRRRQ